MMRSLFAGVSGLKNHQTRMDVIGNNIANVNTVGFKKSRVTFQDMLSQTLRGASSPTTNRGGTNPMQVGLGMTLASIDTIMTPGSPQSTGKNTDLSIEGEGFFILSDGAGTYYTRAGNFDFDYNKNFINSSNGMLVQGILADANGVIDSRGAIADINLASQLSSPPKATTSVSYNKNLDSRATPITATKTGQSHTNGVADSINLGATNLPVTKVVVTRPGPVTYVEGTDYDVNYNTGVVTFKAGSAAPSAADYSVQYWTPNYTSPVTIFDSKGDTHQVTVYYTKSATPNVWEVDTKIDNTFLSPASGLGTITFSPSTGEMTASTVTNAAMTVVGANPLNFALDFDNVTEYAGDYTINAFGQNGYEPGDMQSISVDTSGVLTGVFSNGQSRALAQLATATFSNPSGLMKSGNNLFIESNNSGRADTGVPGISGRGIIKPESLEMSNVDLSQEFVDMIITQRGFQANSRVITTSDQILEELVNLRR